MLGCSTYPVGDIGVDLRHRVRDSTIACQKVSTKHPFRQRVYRRKRAVPVNVAAAEVVIKGLAGAFTDHPEAHKRADACLGVAVTTDAVFHARVDSKDSPILREAARPFDCVRLALETQ